MFALFKIITPTCIPCFDGIHFPIYKNVFILGFLQKALNVNRTEWNSASFKGLIFFKVHNIENRKST